ncbi:MAG: hypothetical protein NVSMB21_25480 [Vulcanimicrobiaceae bacterium]
MIRHVPLRRTALVRKAPMIRRGASLARAGVAKPAKARPPSARQKQTASEYARQRREAIDRDGPRCQLEINLLGTWYACGHTATETAHIERRHVCAKARAHVDVVLRACHPCHELFDSRLAPERVRVPAERMKQCYDTIVALNPRTAPPPGGRPA